MDDDQVQELRPRELDDEQLIVRLLSTSDHASSLLTSLGFVSAAINLEAAVAEIVIRYDDFMSKRGWR
jgi:hypothetical protein